MSAFLHKKTLTYLCLLSLCFSTTVHAADLSGVWTLNYPFEQERWTFVQAGNRFSGATPEFLFIELFARFTMVGTTSGSKFQGVTFFVIAGAPLPSGIVRGTIVGNQMSGRAVDLFFGVYDLEGNRVN